MPHRSVVVIDKVRKDGLVFASDYTDCDHGMDGFWKVMFRLQAGPPRLQIGAAYSLEYESEDLQKPFVQKTDRGRRAGEARPGASPGMDPPDGAEAPLLIPNSFFCMCRLFEPSAAKGKIYITN